MKKLIINFLMFIVQQFQRIKRAAKIVKYRGLTATTSKVLKVIRREGLIGFKFRLLSLLKGHGNDYTEWIRRYDTLTDEDRQHILTKINDMSYKPKISVIMPVYDPPIEMLDEAIHSVRKQLYPNWEFCIADDASKNKEVRNVIKNHANADPRIRFVFRTENGHISRASNSALELATGEFVALFDHDDLLSEQALFLVAETIVTNPNAGIIYSDEDQINKQGLRFNPHFKPDWNPELFLSHNFISHLGVYRRTLVQALGGFRVNFEGSQDYDLALRCVEQLKPNQIIHIPKVLYHWRTHQNSTALSVGTKPYAITSALQALNEHLKRLDIKGRVELGENEIGYRVRYDLPEQPPLVTLIIPTRNMFRYIQRCVESILTKTDYTNYEIIIVDNESDEPETLQYLNSTEENSKIKILRDPRPFNYSSLNNYAVQFARGEIIGLINNDTEVISSNWLTEMVSLAIQPGVGAVGARLWYPNNTLQHGGMFLGFHGIAGHAHRFFTQKHPGYCARAALISSFSAVTGACLIVRKAIYEEVGGLNEIELKVACNDVDFCMRLNEAGYRNIWTPYAELYHHESVSRGHDNTPEKQERAKQEVEYMQKRWGEKLRTDPAYNPNLTFEHEDFSLAWPPRV